MDTLFSRIREALAPAYVVEREIARGGMGIVVQARDTNLDRAVAIKIIRPELATAATVETFTREARLLANLNHPRVVPVYSAGDADGLFYFVMPLIAGETLAQRAARGRFTKAEVKQLALDILEGLASAHSIGVVHRDINARNVFMVEGRALLADFGISVDRSMRESAAAGTVGTMPPEQARGAAITPATDVYAVGALLYWLLTGRVWTVSQDVGSTAWTGVSRSFVRVLKHALQWEPAARYPDAAAFRKALQSNRQRYVGAAALLATVVIAGYLVRPEPRDEKLADLAIVPFAQSNRDSAGLGRNVALLIGYDLQGVPRLKLTPVDRAFRWFDAHGNAPVSSAAPLRAKRLVSGDVVQLGNDVEVHVRVLDDSGNSIADLQASGRSTDLQALADSIALMLLQRLHPRFATTALPRSLTRNVHALREFLQGDFYFQQGSWKFARDHYSAAISHDSTFMWAYWRLQNTQRWMPTVLPEPNMDLAELYHRYGKSLPPAETLAVNATLAPAGPDRFAKLENITREYPHDGYAALMYGVELWHRGPLFRYSQDRALTAIEQAVALDEYLAPAHENIAWIAIRSGDQLRAQRALRRLFEVAGPPEGMDLYTPKFFEQAYLARFEPEQSRELLGFFDARTPGGLEALRFAVRAGVMVKLPKTQAVLAQQLLYALAANSADRANAFEALALAELLRGEHEAGFAHLDSAAAAFRSPEARLEAAEWRELAPLLGWPRPPAQAARADWSFASTVPLQRSTETRVAWARAIAEISRAEVARAYSIMARFHLEYPDEPGARLGIILDAIHAARRGNYDGALKISDRFLPYVAHGKQGDPFARALLYISRARWREALGDRQGAEAELMWAENTDFVGWPSGTVQPAEVDFVLSGYALARRSSLSRAAGKTADACARLHELLFLLQGDPNPFQVNDTGCGT